MVLLLTSTLQVSQTESLKCAENVCQLLKGKLVTAEGSRVWAKEMRTLLRVGHVNGFLGISRTGTSVSQTHPALLLWKHLTKHLICAQGFVQGLQRLKKTVGEP